MPADGERGLVYDTRKGDDRLKVITCCVERWIFRSGHSEALCCKMVTYVHKPPSFCTEKNSYGS